MGSTVVIKDVDEEAFKNLKGEAARAGMKVGEAASESFRLWIQSRRLRRVRDTAKMRKAAEKMDELRARIKPQEGWSSVEVIREWRERRRL